MFTKFLKSDEKVAQNSSVAPIQNEQVDGLVVRSSIRAGATWDDNLGNVGDKTQELLGNVSSWFKSLGS